jgi:NAD(P)-dependent dehydrogenase (short-subunit alcohol dehydrogenase family)
VNILIVGGTAGLGNEYARFCQQKNRQFTIVARNESKDFPAQIANCDLSNLKSVETLVANLVKDGMQFDSMVFFQRSRHHSLEDNWDTELRVQVSSTRIFLQNAEKLLAQDGHKSIVSICSTVTHFVTNSADDAYQVSKSALLQLSRYYARKLGPLGIRLNTVSPFTFIKPENVNFYAANTKWQQFVLNRIPLQMSCTTQDIISGIEFLLSKEAKMITGHELVIDGGVSLSLGDDF